MIQAVSDKIIVEELIRSKTSGGLVIPEKAVMDPQAYGRVVSVGPAVSTWEDSPEKNLEKGDVITFHPRSGMAAVFKQQAFRIVKFDEVYGKVTDEEIIEDLDIIKMGAIQEKEESNIIHPVS